MSKAPEKQKRQNETIPEDLMWKKEVDSMIQMSFEECLDCLFDAQDKDIIFVFEKVSLEILSADSSSASFIMSLGQGLLKVWLIGFLEYSADENTVIKIKSGGDIIVILLFVGLTFLLLFAVTFFSKSLKAGFISTLIVLTIFISTYLFLISARNSLITSSKEIFLKNYERVY